VFGYDQPTAFDLRFRIFGFPVRVHPLFWLIAALLGEPLWRVVGFQYLLVWIACVFFSILLHELGHAFLIRRFGSPSLIVLTGFGGYAQMPYPPDSPWKRMAISLAGAGIQLAFAGLIYASEQKFDWASTSLPTLLTYHFLIWINIYWALFNLLPIYPMDGGQATLQLFRILKLRNPDAAVHTFSIITAGILVLRGVTTLMQVRLAIIDDILPMWLTPSLFMMLFFVMFIVYNYQMLQIAQRRRSYYDDDDSPPWRR